VLAAAALALLVALNLGGCTRVGAYVLVGVFLWVCVLKSGVHATLAGVALGFAIPVRGAVDGDGPLHRLELSLHPWVAFGILPLFALANAGVSLSGLSLASVLSPTPLGIALGLFVGKQLGSGLHPEPLHRDTRLRGGRAGRGRSSRRPHGIPPVGRARIRGASCILWSSREPITTE